MFRPNIRSSLGLRQTKSLVLCVYWDRQVYVIHFIQHKIDTYQILYILTTVKHIGIPIYNCTSDLVCRRPEDDLMLVRIM